MVQIVCEGKDDSCPDSLPKSRCYAPDAIKILNGRRYLFNLELFYFFLLSRKPLSNRFGRFLLLCLSNRFFTFAEFGFSCELEDATC